MGQGLGGGVPPRGGVEGCVTKRWGWGGAECHHRAGLRRWVPLWGGGWGEEGGQRGRPRNGAATEQGAQLIPRRRHLRIRRLWAA